MPVGVIMGGLELAKFIVSKLSKNGNGKAVIDRLDRIEAKLDDRHEGEIHLRERVTRLEARRG